MRLRTCSYLSSITCDKGLPSRQRPYAAKRAPSFGNSETDAWASADGHAVIGEFRVGNTKVSLRGMIRVGSQFAMKPQRTNVRAILIPCPMRYKGLVGDGQRVFKGSSELSRTSKSIRGRGFRLKAEILHNVDRVCQAPPNSSADNEARRAGFRRLARND